MRWPRGIRSAGTSCGIKRGGKPDLGILVADSPITWAGTFTRNAAAAASVGWDRSLMGREVRAVVVNSGNANACTGAVGRSAVQATAAAAAGLVGCSPGEVLVSSTGPIGVRLPVNKVVDALPGALESLTEDVASFAGAIVTTDSHPKVAGSTAGGATVVGVAKGAAMIAPNMATMLAFIATDAAVERDRLQTILSRSVDVTFNRISVDACESTNDSVFLLAAGTARNTDDDLLAKAVEDVCRALAEDIVRDAEGASRLVRIEVCGASRDRDAVEMGRAVAASALWRSAVHGGDPNWGRIVSALGAHDRSLDLGMVEVWIGDECVFDAGEPAGSLERASAEMQGEEVRVRCVVGSHPGVVEVLSTELTPEYVNLNAGGMS
ncbi:MAG: bifunctional glutamate N-acetyltransferase/amino-acid acetyltransferase ArgJ [Actinomycetota bacterium]